MNNAIVELEEITKNYKDGETEITVLKGVSLKILPGEFVVILGVSGSGKTTLLNLIGGLDKPSKGEVIFSQTRLSNLSQDELTQFRREKIGFIFQFYNLFHTLTAAENIELSLEILNLSSKDIRRLSEEYLEYVGLLNKKDKFPSQLSGGEQQRVAIARALAKKPLLVLADEPTGNLDSYNGEKIITLMKELNEKSGITFIVATHNVQISKIANRTFSIANGELVFEKDLYKNI